jgi:hypothetical protein
MGPTLLFARDTHFAIHKMLRSVPKNWPQVLKLLVPFASEINAQHFMNLFPKVAKSCFKKTFTTLVTLTLQKLALEFSFSKKLI